MKFNVYIDESGEAGIAKIRGENLKGSSPYFVMAAVVCQPTAEVHAKNVVLEFKDRIGKKVGNTQHNLITLKKCIWLEN